MTSLRSIPESFSTGALDEIDRLLDRITSDHRVSISLAIESGSRAWGFPSLDSDYDCRFVYIRSVDQYLSPWVPRDVIETPLIDDLDVNGWDLGKALKLMLKGNAVIVEWLRSPLVYRGDGEFRAEFLSLAQSYSNRTLIGRHYLHLGERQRNTYFGDGKDVAIKKLFYALRPAAALRWMRYHSDCAIPPMHFPTLIAECEPPKDVAELVDELLVRKSETRELGSAPLPEIIRKFVDGEFIEARKQFEQEFIRIEDRAKEAASDFFRDCVRQFG